MVADWISDTRGPDDMNVKYMREVADKQYDIKTTGSTTKIQIVVEKCENVEFTHENETLHYIELDAAVYGFKPVVHPTMPQLHEWARKHDLRLSAIDELNAILQRYDNIGIIF